MAFQTILGGEEQPAEVVEAYGEQGEHITGPDVAEVGDMRRVEDTSQTTPRGEAR